MRTFIHLRTALLSLGLLLAHSGAQGRGAEEVFTVNPTGAARTLNGAGSTFAAPIIKEWMRVYGGEHPDLGLSYAVVGSGAGIDRFLAGTVDIGATDAPLTPADVAKVKGDVLQIPVTAGMIAITYNLPTVKGPLNLPRAVYPDIFQDKIVRWDDPRIAAANPGVALPHKLIQVVTRRDSSGTTFAFTNHLAAVSPAWAAGLGVAKALDWPGGAMTAPGNEGVAQRIKLTEGSIGYVESGFAERLGLPLAWLENRAGGFIVPTVETGQRALTGGSDTIPEALHVMITDPEGARSYPIVTYTWLLLRRQYDDPVKTAAIKDLVGWILTQGQARAEPLRFVPLPANITQAAQGELATLGE